MSRNVATNSHSGLTDSQLFYGSQFWLENSQGTSQDLSLSSKNSQQSSQEGSDSKFVNSYHTKPLLLGDYKDKTKTSGLLGKFEEDKEKAKEKNDRDLLAKESQYIRETLITIKQLVTSAEANTAVCKTVFEKMDNIATTLENNLKIFQNNISQRFETLVDKVNSQKQFMTELEERVQKSGNVTPEFESHLQSLKNSLQCLKEEQERERHLLEEALKLLNAVVSEHSAKPHTEGVMDSAIQTSPRLEQLVSNTLQDDQAEGNKLPCAANSGHHEAKAFSHEHVLRRKFTTKGQRRGKKRPLVLPKRSKCTVSDENSQPANDCTKQQKLLTPLREHCNQSKLANKLSLSSGGLKLLNRGNRSGEAVNYLINPVSYWSPDSSSSPECLTALEPILEKLVGESNIGSPVKPGGLWQLFESDLDL